LLFLNRKTEGVKTILLFLLILFKVSNSVFGQEVFIPEITRFEGLRRTKPTIVFRELAYKQGDRILLEDTGFIFKKSASNVFNTRLFNFCQYELDSSWTDSLGIKHGSMVFTVSERWYTFPNPIFELADRNLNEWLYDRDADIRRVNIGIRFKQKNVRGRNEDLLFAIQGGFTRRLDLDYVIPYLDKKQVFGLRFFSSFANNKDVAVRSEGNRLVYKRDEDSFGRARFKTGIQVSARRSINDYHYLDMSYNFNRISAFTYAQNPLYFLGKQFQRFSEIRYSFVSDHRNFRNFATKGHWLSIYVSRYGILPYDNFHIWSARIAFSKFTRLAPNLFLGNRLDFEISTDEQQPYLGTRVLGFDNRYVRGYERYVMEGTMNGYSRNTLRYKFFSRSFTMNWVPLHQFRFLPLDLYISPFLDAGYVQNSRIPEPNKRLVNTLLLGYGMGLNIVTFYDVILRAEYSLTRHGDKGFYLSFLSDI
jgi:hypothetical protein